MFFFSGAYGHGLCIALSEIDIKGAGNTDAVKIFCIPHYGIGIVHLLGKQTVVIRMAKPAIKTNFSSLYF